MLVTNRQETDQDLRQASQYKLFVRKNGRPEAVTDFLDIEFEGYQSKINALAKQYSCVGIQSLNGNFFWVRWREFKEDYVHTVRGFLNLHPGARRAYANLMRKFNEIQREINDIRLQNITIKYDPEDDHAPPTLSLTIRIVAETVERSRCTSIENELWSAIGSASSYMNVIVSRF